LFARDKLIQSPQRSAGAEIQNPKLKIMIERIVNKFNSFEEAHRFDIEQQVNMTNAQRMEGLRILKERAYGINVKDIRECHQSK
jgi:hypothetical protein